MAQRGPALAGVDDPFAYLCRVMVTVAATWGKRDSDRRRRELTAPGTSERVGQRDLDLVGALSRLPPGQRGVIYFRYLEDLTVAQTAQLLGCRQGTVKSQAAKAIQALARDPRLNG